MESSNSDARLALEEVNAVLKEQVKKEIEISERMAKSFNKKDKINSTKSENIFHIQQEQDNKPSISDLSPEFYGGKKIHKCFESLSSNTKNSSLQKVANLSDSDENNKQGMNQSSNNTSSNT